MILGFLAEDVLEMENIIFDKQILLFVHAQATPALDQLMVFISLAGSKRFVIPFDVMIFMLLLCIKQRSHAFFWGLAVGGAALINLIAKSGFSRQRPSLWVSISPETTFSFPSGHAMQTMAIGVALVIILWNTPWQWFVLLLTSSFVLSVGVSRIYLDVHYPSDVLASWAASIVWVVGLQLIVKTSDFFKNPSN